MNLALFLKKNCEESEERMKKNNWLVICTGAVVGLAALVLTMLGNPGNMGFCIACFLRDISGALGLHSRA